MTTDDMAIVELAERLVSLYEQERKSAPSAERANAVDRVFAPSLAEAVEALCAALRTEQALGHEQRLIIDGLKHLLGRGVEA